MLASSNLPIVGHRYFFFIITFLILYLSISYIISCFPHIDNKITNKKQISHNDKILSSNSHSCLGPESNEERYMTYLPHSGFHNQRNMLENAVFLSWVLNRTLIMPPIIFTKKTIIPHRPYNILYSMITGNMTKNVITCKKKGVEDKKCMFTQLDWEELMDFKFIKKYIRYIHREDQNFNVNELYSFLNITKPESQVFTLAEETRYDFQFYDDENITEVSDDQFDHLIHLCSLQKRKEKLIHFGSIYHLNRFNLKFKENIDFLKSVRENMIINHPVLLDIGDKISEQLGGLGSYIGVHLRLGDMGFDKKFGQKAEENKKLKFQIQISFQQVL
ncbi:CigA protein [Rhizophagus irregularis DAOM 181602=DAOM 197198]|nr:CigA protein [Rhizophagus irregularis DAOM 181602=DAOM 197198]